MISRMPIRLSDHELATIEGSLRESMRQNQRAAAKYGPNAITIQLQSRDVAAYRHIRREWRRFLRRVAR